MKNKQRILLSSVVLSVFLLAGTGISKAQEDVFVDLSVLDNLDGGDSSVSSQPLFPVVSSSVKKQVKKTTRKPSVKKAPAKSKKIVKNSVEASEDEISIPKRTSIEIKELKPVKAERAQKVDLSSEAAQIEGQPVNKEAVDKILPSLQNDAKESVTLPEVQPGVVVTPIAEASEAEMEMTPINTAPVSEPHNLPAQADLPAPAATAVADVPADQLNEEGPAPQPLIQPQMQVKPGKAVSVKADGNLIAFAEGVSELSDADKAKIDEIIRGFEDSAQNRIGIFAYNYDNGEDVFRRKRQSLTRAVEIRSYLLSKGYKIFSLKVLNISEADKNNMVLIEELK